MTETDKAEFEIQVGLEDATKEEVDRTTRQLLFELRELNVESVELTRSETAPSGSKGDPVSIGSIALELLPELLPVVLGMVQAWSARGQRRSVKFKGKVGKELVEFEGSPEELQKLLEKLEKGGIKK